METLRNVLCKSSRLHVYQHGYGTGNSVLANSTKWTISISSIRQLFFRPLFYCFSAYFSRINVFIFPWWRWGPRHGGRPLAMAPLAPWLIRPCIAKFLSLRFIRETSTANQISSRYLNWRLKYNYFRFRNTNVLWRTWGGRVVHVGKGKVYACRCDVCDAWRFVRDIVRLGLNAWMRERGSGKVSMRVNWR